MDALIRDALFESAREHYGEEIFEVRLDPHSEAVTYRVRAASRPRAALARIGYPIARMLQAKFRRDSSRLMTSLL